MIQSKWLISGLFILAIGFSNYGQGKENLVIGLKVAHIKDKPSLIAKTVGKAKYGQSLPIIGKKKDWYKVKFKSGVAWAHKTAFASKEFVLKDIGKGEQASKSSYKDEVVTAGKGFSPEYESMYKSKNPKLKYGSVDNLEKRKVPIKRLHKFAVQGGLKSEVFDQ